MHKKLDQDRIAAAHRVAAKLFALENTMDTCISEAAALMAELPAARRDGKLSAVVGQEAFLRVSGILPLLAAARGEIVISHHSLSAFQREVGIDEIAFGGGWKQLAALQIVKSEEREAA